MVLGRIYLIPDSLYKKSPEFLPGFFFYLKSIIYSSFFMPAPWDRRNSEEY